MTEFTIHTVESAPEGSRAQLATTRSAWGFVPNLHGILAESPTALIAYDTLFGLMSQSTLTPAEQQIIYLTISVFNGCEYCTMGHTYLARAADLDESEIQRLRHGEPLSNPRSNALGAFVRNVVAQRGRVGDAAVEAFVAAGFTRANVLEVVTAVATKTISNYTNHITHTPREGFMADAALAWTAPAEPAALA